jgi:prophage tail gpP-like protein
VAFNPTPPEGDVVALVLTNSNLQISNWISYRFNSDFLTPSDAFSFTVADEKVDDATKAALLPGAPVQLVYNGKIQASGYIDSIARSASRESGIEWTIDGRDVLGQAVDACADPTIVFQSTATLLDVLTTVLGPFGFPDPVANYATDNQANRNVITGAVRGVPTSKKGKPLKSFLSHQLKPHDAEGAYQFCARLMQRQALWLWPSADGKTLVVGTPDFDQAPIFLLQRSAANPANNVLAGTVKYDLTEQPTAIVADGFSGGGEFGHGRLRSVLINATCINPNQAYYTALGQKFRDAKLLTPRHAFYTQMSPPFARTIFRHDDESKTQDELDAFVYREMAKCMRHSLTAHYTVEGHAQTDASGNAVPWAVDCVVDVHDDVGNVQEPMWILSRTFNKSRNGGTTTDLELVRLYGLEF